MKKVLTVLLILVVLLAAAGSGLWGYVATHPATEADIPTPALQLWGQALSPNSAQWHVPQLGGLRISTVTYTADTPTHALSPDAVEAALASAAVPLVLPEGYETTLTLTQNGTQVYSGPAGQLDETLLTQPGSYLLTAECTRLQEKRADEHGTLLYRAAYTVPEPVPDPVLLTGRAELQQGDIFTLHVSHVPEGVTPTATTELGMAVFTPCGEQSYCAAVPVGNACPEGTYTVSVEVGEFHWEPTVTVSAFAFDHQNLIIDTSNPQISEANSPEAYQQYNEVMSALWETYDEERYWDGLFIWPAEGRITTNFGEIRITNGDPSTVRSHNGMDIAPGRIGPPVIAPNHGRVVLAEYLLNTGWTIAIEHGGGLKSYYFHLNELYVEVGDFVTQGEHIGDVGTTGYSTGPHLHFEMRIGSHPISPQMLFEETAGLYSLESLHTESSPEAETAAAA